MSKSINHYQDEWMTMQDIIQYTKLSYANNAIHYER